MTIARAVIAWQRRHGRHDLPWQDTRDPYRIWVSEIMLQQTQVATVIPYYERFMSSFPTLAALADADLDRVLAHWSGLGYYSRARNLHRAAWTLRDVHGGSFPRSFDAVAALPGIGRSTAGAIMVFAFGARYPILDGNVKRVLARACGIEGYPGDRSTAEALWSAAERLLPRRGIETYTQGLMDLGATVCRRRRPTCAACPLNDTCVALRDRRVEAIPAPRPRKVLPHRRTTMLVFEHRGEILLEKRPPSGIWGGLWCFPEAAPDEPMAVTAQRYGVAIREHEQLADVEHGFTHFSLTISPRRFEVASRFACAAEADRVWLSLDGIDDTGVPAPVKRIIEGLRSTDLFSAGSAEEAA